MDYITTREAASHLRVTPYTIRRWAQQGLIGTKIPSATIKGHWRFQLDELDRFVNKGKGE